MSEVLKKKWTVLEEPDYNQILQLSQDTDIPLPLSKILIRRNVNNKVDAKRFFVPDLKYLYDPFLMKDMDKASQRLLKVIENKEKIMVFGDYDVDGTSGVSMFYCFLKNLGITPLVYIPDRFTEGYGLSKTGIQQAAKNNIKLIIAIDCGITAFDKVEYANSLDIEIIICDHHQPPELIPSAYAVLDALQDGCNYPLKDLCGTGVAFKLIQAVCEKLGSDLHLSLLDFVAIATAADMVPVIDENRILVHFGFKQIIENPRPSFLTLIKNSGFKIENLNTSSVAYALGPRINAVGRLGDANRAVEFLTCDDMSKVDSLAGVLESENINRKKIDSEIYSQAQSSYESYLNRSPDANDVAIVLHDPEWHPGVLGIIASRMVEKYYRPSIILTNFKGVAKGSARSIHDFNIYDALKQCAAVFPGLIQFGGHFYAAGLEVEIEKIDEFRNT
ncbi:MAG: single-stranded-DNA-specific exonuclease RecJ, partial [Ignavibacteria bacterium]